MGFLGFRARVRKMYSIQYPTGSPLRTHYDLHAPLSGQPLTLNWVTLSISPSCSPTLGASQNHDPERLKPLNKIPYAHDCPYPNVPACLGPKAASSKFLCCKYLLHGPSELRFGGWPRKIFRAGRILHLLDSG